MKKTLATFIIFISLIIFENSSTEAYEIAVPKWLDGEVLEVCTVTQDVKINQRWEEDNGAWIKGSPTFLKEGDLLTIHKSKSKTIKKWYNSPNGRFPVRSTNFHKVTLDKDYGKLKNKEVGKKKVKDVIENCKKPEIKTALTNKKTKDFSKDSDSVTIPQADIDQAYKYEQIVLVTVACSKNKRGDPEWHDTFIGIINVNTFQGTRSWRSNSGYEIFNGFKNKNNFTIKVDGRYTNKSDRWDYKFVSKGTLSIRDHLKNGIETFKGKDKSRRKCKIQSAANDIIVPVRESMHAFYAKDKKSMNSEKLSKLETDLTKTKKEKTVLQKTIKELKDEINKINLETVNKNNEKIKAEEEKKLAEEKKAEEKRLAEEKKAEEKRLSEEKKLAEQRKIQRSKSLIKQKQLLKSIYEYSEAQWENEDQLEALLEERNLEFLRILENSSTLTEWDGVINKIELMANGNVLINIKFNYAEKTPSASIEQVIDSNLYAFKDVESLISEEKVIFSGNLIIEQENKIKLINLFKKSKLEKPKFEFEFENIFLENDVDENKIVQKKIK